MNLFIQRFAIIIFMGLLLNCNEKKESPETVNPKNRNDGFRLIANEEAFSNFNCKVKGDPLSLTQKPFRLSFTPISSCPSIALSQVGDFFWTNILKMDVDSKGNFYLLLETYDADDESTYFGKFSFVKIDIDGNSIFEIKAKEGDVFESFVLHPSGEVSLVETRKPGTGNNYRVWLRRLNSEGKLLHESLLKDKTIANAKNGSPLVYYYAGSVLLANGEGLYLTSFTDKGKIYSLTKDFQIEWSHQHFPNYQGVIVPGSTKMFLDNNQRLLLVKSVLEIELPNLEQKFGETYSNKKDGGIIVYRFSSDGKTIEHKVITDNGYISVAGIHLDGNLVTIAGNKRVKKFNEPNNTYESDLVLFKFDIVTGLVLENKIFDLQRDDAVENFSIDQDGNSIFVGKNNYVQVDSRSVVEFGQAFILKIAPNGDTKNYVTFSGPRNTGISSHLLIKDSGEMYFSGVFDGPITHTGDNDKSLRFLKTMIGQIHF